MFDIDKLGLSTLNYNRNGSDIFEVGSEKYYQNQLIKDYLTLLTDPKSQHILHRSIDNDTKLLKDVLAEIETDSAQEEMPYGFYSLSTQTERKDDYITGKIGIGPFALNNNNHILTMLYGVKFKDFDDSIMSKLGLTDLSISHGQDGKSIMSWISALINAHVDIAKDPYIARLNVNPFTYNLANTLIRTGFGKKTFYFTTQPIMKLLARAYNNAASSYMADKNKSIFLLQKEAVENVAKDRFEKEKIGDWTFDEIVEGISDPLDTKYKPVINEYIKRLFDGDALKENANKPFGIGATVNGTKLNGNQVLMLMYFAYLQFNPYAISVSNLVKYSKIDTKKHGKSYVEQQVFSKGFNDLFYNRESGGLFEEEGLRRLAEDSYVGLKTTNAIQMTKAVLKGQFLQATNAFDNAVQVVLNMIGKSDSKNVDLHNKILQAITASIKSEFINQYAQNLPQYHSTYIRDLVSESEEELEYTQSAESNRLKITGAPKYNLKSYIGGTVYATFDHEGKTYNRTYAVLGYDEESGELIVNEPRKVNNTGKIRITGGKNTIYDRFLSLGIELRDDPAYKDVLDASGEPANMLLRSLVNGETFQYKAPAQVSRMPEVQDTYPTLKFVKLFNALDLNGVESNYIIDAWDELLHDTKHPKLQRFAQDLVVYAFVTSGDQGGFTKFFKHVPFSWREESGYGDFIDRKLTDFLTLDISIEQLQDAILNNWHDNRLVPTYYLLDENGTPNFIAYSGENQSSSFVPVRSYPTILAALKKNENGYFEPSIDPNKAPLFIKLPRRKEQTARDSQRRVTVYKRVSYGMRQAPNGNWVSYPVYVKVEPKGNLVKGNYLMTEYGREDSTYKEYTPNQEALKKMYQLGDFIAKSTLEKYKIKFGTVFAEMIEDMNYRDLLVNRFKGNIYEFNKEYTLENSIDDLEIFTRNVYHATQNEFNEFKIIDGETTEFSFHFGTKAAAEDVARMKNYGDNYHMMELYIPDSGYLELDDFIHDNPIYLLNVLRNKNIINEDLFNKLNSQIVELKTYMKHSEINKLFANLFNSLGYNGIAYKNSVEDIGSISYAIFDSSKITTMTPEQLKEAKEIKKQCRGGK